MQAADKTRPSETERKEGVDFGKLKDKGKEHAKHTVSGLYKAQAKESAFDSAVDAVKVKFLSSFPSDELFADGYPAVL